MIDLSTLPASLFCPGDQPHRFRKAAESADVVVIDLEDGVGPDRKALARDCMADSGLDPLRVIVRVNALDSRDHAADLRAVRRTDYSVIMIPKAESRSSIESLVGFDVVPIVETAKGVVSARRIAYARNAIAMVWGAEDLTASLGGFSSRNHEGAYRDFARFARNEVLFAARSNDLVALDAVYMNVPDLDGLAAEAEDAAASGFGGKVCIHPSQVPVVRKAFSPTADQVEHALRVLRAAEEHQGVFILEGQMIDEPLLLQARHIVAVGHLATGNS